MEKRFLGVVVLLLLSLSLVSAVDLTVQNTQEDTAMIYRLNQPAVFYLNITNNGPGDFFQFYDYFGSDIFPKGTVEIDGMQTKLVPVGIYPRDDMTQTGWVNFPLYIRGQNKDEMNYSLMVNVVKLQDAFAVGAEDFKPDSGNVTVYIQNLLNFNFNNLDVKFSSPFFNFEQVLSSIGPHEKKSVEITLNKEDYRDLMAGFYTMNAEVAVGNENTNVQGTIKFVEKDIVSSTQNQFGVIINTNTITKTNEGNVVSSTTTVIKKNIISRLFTSFSPDPTTVDRKGLVVYYTWQKDLNPGQSFAITVKTNWLIPLLIVLLVIVVVILTKQFSKTNLSLKKRVTFVRAKGGEFALKVSVIVTARRFVERVNVIDRLPPITKLHERFGGETPKKVDIKNRKIEWYFERLHEGESRVISYIIYSKVGVLGKFVLPVASAVYEKDGEVHNAESNRAFFIAEQARKPIED